MIKLSKNKITLDIEPFTTNNQFGFVMCQMTEVIGGQLPYGRVILNKNGEEAEEIAKKTYSIHIRIEQEKPEHIEYDIVGMIIHREWSPEFSEFSFDFLGLPDLGEGDDKGVKGSKRANKNFWTEKKISVYPTPYKAMKALWPWTWLDEGSRPEIPPADWDCEIHQEMETDYDVLCKVAMGYRKNAIFGFSWKGFVMKDIKSKDWVTGGNEPDTGRTMSGGESVQVMDMFNMNYNKELYHDIQDPCTDPEDAPGKESSLNIKTLVMQDHYQALLSRSDGTDSPDLGEDKSKRDYMKIWRNYIHNRRLMESKMYSSCSVRYTNGLPKWHLGDTVFYGKAQEKDKPSTNTFIISENTFFFSKSREHVDQKGEKFSITAILRGIQEIGGKELPDGFDNDPALQ